MTDTKRDEFIKAVREIRPPMFPAPERQGFFLRNPGGGFVAPGLEAAYVGWCLKRGYGAGKRPCRLWRWFRKGCK